MTSILGISAFYHDSAAALVIDGNIIAAAQEERFSRKKHDSSYPFNAVEFVLKKSKLKLNEYLRMSSEEINRGGNLRDSALADELEALIGAIFIDKGYEFVNFFIINLFKNSFENINELQNYKDPKSLLQEMVQAEALDPPKYVLNKVSGPSHNPIFKTDLYINDIKISSSDGNKKIISEQNAAEMAINYLEKNKFDEIKTKKTFFKKIMNRFR